MAHRVAAVLAGAGAPAPPPLRVEAADKIPLTPLRLLTKSRRRRRHPPTRRRGDASPLLAKLIGGPVRLFTTKCVMAELRGLGPAFKATRQVGGPARAKPRGWWRGAGSCMELFLHV